MENEDSMFWQISIEYEFNFPQENLNDPFFNIEIIEETREDLGKKKESPRSKVDQKESEKEQTKKPEKNKDEETEKYSGNIILIIEEKEKEKEYSFDDMNFLRENEKEMLMLIEEDSFDDFTNIRKIDFKIDLSNHKKIRIFNTDNFDLNDPLVCNIIFKLKKIVNKEEDFIFDKKPESENSDVKKQETPRTSNNSNKKDADVSNSSSVEDFDSPHPDSDKENLEI
jgi:hypothetical protein